MTIKAANNNIIPIDFLTFVIGIPGSRTHRFMRHLIDKEGYADYVPNKNSKLIEHFPFHPSYTFDNGFKFPRLFDRLEKHIINHDNYYYAADKKLYNRYLEQGKKLITVSHTPPNIIRERYPYAKIYYVRGDYDASMKRYEFFKSLHSGKTLPEVDWKEVQKEMESNITLVNHIVNYEE
jgi:hypothetical protein